MKTQGKFFLRLLFLRIDALFLSIRLLLIYRLYET